MRYIYIYIYIYIHIYIYISPTCEDGRILHLETQQTKPLQKHYILNPKIFIQMFLKKNELFKNPLLFRLQFLLNIFSIKAKRKYSKLFINTFKVKCLIHLHVEANPLVFISLSALILTLNCIWWWASSPGVCRVSLAITPRSTLTQSGTCQSQNYW